MVCPSREEVKEKEDEKKEEEKKKKVDKEVIKEDSNKEGEDNPEHGLAILSPKSWNIIFDNLVGVVNDQKEVIDRQLEDSLRQQDAMTLMANTIKASQTAMDALKPKVMASNALI